MSAKIQTISRTTKLYLNFMAYVYYIDLIIDSIKFISSSVKPYFA